MKSFHVFVKDWCGYRLKAIGFCLPVVLLLCCGVFLFAGCATVEPVAAVRPVERGPSWWPGRDHDVHHLYFQAQTESRVSVEQARQEALRSIRSQIAEYIVSEVEVRDDAAGRRVSVETSMTLREVEVFGEHSEQSGGRWTFWMQGRFPRSEYNLIRQRLELGASLDAQWREAQSAVNRRERIEAQRLLLDILERYDRDLRVSFAEEEVKLSLARVSQELGDNFKARQWAEDVRQGSRDRDWRREAERFLGQLPALSMLDALKGRTVAVYGLASRDGGIIHDLDLARALGVRLSRNDIRATIASGVLGRETIVVDEAVLGMLARPYVKSEADVVFVLLLDVNPLQTGRRETVYGVEREVMDARLHYWIIRAGDGSLLAADSVIGYSRSADALLNTILTHRRHAAHAPAIIEGLRTR